MQNALAWHNCACTKVERFVIVAHTVISYGSKDKRLWMYFFFNITSSLWVKFKFSVSLYNKIITKNKDTAEQ